MNVNTPRAGLRAPPAVLNATVVAELPQRLFRLETEDGSTLIAGESSQTRRLGIAFKAGDRVRVRPAPFDKGRGTILGRLDRDG